MIRLESIQIEGYRSCKGTHFAPHSDLSVLIGPNGSGKTNVLSAVTLLRSLVWRRLRAMRFQPSAVAPEVRLTSTFNLDGKSLKHRAKLLLETDEHNVDEILDSQESWYAWDITGNRREPTFPLELVHQLDLTESGRRNFISLSSRIAPTTFRTIRKQLSLELRGAMIEVSRFIGGIRYYSASQFTDPSKSPVSFEVDAEEDRRRGVSMRGHKKLLFDMYETQRTDPNLFDEFLCLVDRTGLRLIDGIRFQEQKVSSSEYEVRIGGRLRKKERARLLVIPQFDLGRNVLSPSQLSEGTFKTIALLFHLVTNKGSLLLVEEPEVCVHHGLLSSILEIIKNYSFDKQIVVSTHSEVVLDHVDSKHVFSVKNDPETGTNVESIEQSLDPHELLALREYLSTEGSLGEYWRSSGFDTES